MEILLYLVPGIISKKIIHTLLKSLPRDEDTFSKTIDLIIISVINYFITIIILIIRFRIKDDETLIGYAKSLDFINYFVNENFFVVLVVIIGPILLTSLFYLIGYKLYAKSSGESIGANAYIDNFFNNSVYQFEDKDYSFPVQVFHKGVVIGKGYLTSKYTIPWDYKEIYIEQDNLLSFNESELVYTYYDFQSEIKMEIYKFENKGENDNG